MRLLRPCPNRCLAMTVLGALLFLQTFLQTVEAGQEIRGFQPIPSPETQAQAAGDLESEGFQKMTVAQNLPPEVTEKVVYDLFSSWNTSSLAKKLSKDFTNKARILDSIQTGAPRQTRLQVLSIQNPRIVEQYLRPHPDGDGSFQILSKVAVRVSSQVATSSGISKNFVRRDGTSEYLVSIRQKVRVP